MHELERWGLSGQLLVSGEKRVLLEESYGLANRSLQIPVASTTVFDIASLSKQFTACAILALQEAGHLELAAPIGTYLQAVPPDRAAITIHQLLTHTSGLVDPNEPPGDTLETSLDASEFILSSPLGAPPGSSYAYSNVGYVLLAAIIERVSGTSFEEYLQARLFEVAGLERTGFAWQRDRWADGDVAVGVGAYEGRFRSGDPRDRADDWLRRGPGGVLSNARDLYEWESALRSGKILTAASLERLFRPYTTAEADFLSYAYGWRVQKTPRETTLIWHTGWDEAFSAVLRHYVEEDRTVIFLSNKSVDLTPVRELVLRSAREGELGERLFGGKSNEVFQPGTPPSPAVAGRYRLDDGGLIVVRVAKGSLFLSPGNQRGAEALVHGAMEDREELLRAGAEAEALLRALALDQDTLDPLQAARIDPYGFADADISQLRTQMVALRSELGDIHLAAALATLPVGMPGRTRAVSTVRLAGTHGFSDYRVVWFGEDEVYVLSGPSEALERKFVSPDHGASAFSVDLLSGQTTFVRFERDALLVRLSTAARWRRVERETEER